MAWACWAASLGCAGEPRSSVPPPAYYADVKPILDAKCVQCHDGSGIGVWTDLTWYGDGAMRIPAGDTDVMFSVELDPTLFVSSGQSFRMYSVGLHMHGLGTQGRIEIRRAGGDVDCLLDMPRWDPLPPQDVDWGESVRDEMCLGGFYLSVL